MPDPGQGSTPSQDGLIIQHRASSIQHRASSIQHRASSIEHRASVSSETGAALKPYRTILPRGVALHPGHEEMAGYSPSTEHSRPLTEKRLAFKRHFPESCKLKQLNSINEQVSVYLRLCSVFA